LSALAYNLFLGQPAVFDDVTAWTHSCIDDLEDLPTLKVQWDGKYFKAGKSVIVDLKMHELDEFIKKVDPTGIMLWIPAEPSEQKDILERVSQW
jgi:hypothetical protein